MNEFKKLGLSEKTLEALERKGFETPTPIQKLTIPLLLKGNKDIIGKAQTGTGKTACFALPIIENISDKSPDVQAIILTPTRELALQVSKEIESLQGEHTLSILAVYGGAPIRDQMSRLKRGVQIVVGTPGRVMDLINRRKLNLHHVTYAVLDEADEMLNMGFVDDMKEILSHTSNNKRMLFFSATMPKEILRIAKQFMKEFDIIEVDSKQVTAVNTKQIYYDIRPKDRIEALHRIMDITPDFHGIVFCRTKVMVDDVTMKLKGKDYHAAALHGDISQAQREKILRLFRKRNVHVLVATDVAARGIDVNDLTHVINFSLPQSPESYVHRIGRTGRAGKEGIAISFIIPSEKRRLKFIEKTVKQQLIKGVLPSIKEVLEVKKKGLKTRIDKMLTDDHTKKYDDITSALLSEHKPEKVVASLLKYIFKSEIETNKYKEVEKVSGKFERSRGRDKKPYGGRSRDGRGYQKRSKDFTPRGKGRGSRDNSRGKSKEGSSRGPKDFAHRKSKGKRSSNPRR
jgi:ATP-dependent RNA helicase DeaD